MPALPSVRSWPKNVMAALAMTGTLAAGVAGGFAARALHLPLPWLLGALAATMAMSLSGAPVRPIPWGRPARTVVVGASPGPQFTLNPVAAVPTAPWVPLLAALAVSGLIATLLSRTRSPNAWLMAPLFIAALLGNLGLLSGRMPDVLLIAAQVVIGSSLGAQFRPEFLTRLFGLLWASFLVVLLAAGAMGLVGAGIAWLRGYPVPTMILATPPAGIAEMTLTGKVLGLDSTVIAG